MIIILRKQLQLQVTIISTHSYMVSSIYDISNNDNNNNLLILLYGFKYYYLILLIGKKLYGFK